MAHKYTQDSSDAYLRWRIKKTFASIKPPPDGKKHLLRAALEETVKSNSKYSHLNNIIEKEAYRDDHAYLGWVMASRFHFTLLSTIKLR
jgi:hypothetical protein